MTMTMETMLLLAVLSRVVMLLRSDEDRSAVARIPATSRRVRDGRGAA